MQHTPRHGYPLALQRSARPRAINPAFTPPGYPPTTPITQPPQPPGLARPRAAPGCIWDLKVVYSDDDSSAVWRNIDLCKIETITIRYNRNTDTTSASFD